MPTVLLDHAADPEGSLDRAAEILRGGGLVAFPTETVYGLGALGLDPAAVERIFQAKERPHADPLILHVGERDWIIDLAGSLPPLAAPLMGALWPGPLTLVVPRSPRVPALVTAGLDSVAVRMPAHPVALALIRRVGAPLAAPSANRFTRPSPTTAQHVLEDLDGRIDAVLDGGPTTLGIESTVLDLRGDVPVILRPGGVPREALEGVLGCPVEPSAGLQAGAGTRSPGQMERHYSPRAEVLLFDGDNTLPELRAAAEVPGTAVLAYTEDLPALQGLPGPIRELGSRSDPKTVAHTLYGGMRDLDALGVSRIAVRTVPPGGLGDAINDRLRRAAAGVVRRPG